MTGSRARFDWPVSVACAIDSREDRPRATDPAMADSRNERREEDMKSFPSGACQDQNEDLYHAIAVRVSADYRLKTRASDLHSGRRGSEAPRQYFPPDSVTHPGEAAPVPGCCELPAEPMPRRR